jgi:hypothetical protein
MGKHSAYREVENALLKAIYEDNEAPVLSPLESLTEPLLIYTHASQHLSYLRQLSRSLETNIRYHQGRALALDDPRNATMTSGLSPYEKRAATNVYQLFRDHEWLISRYTGTIRTLAKITNPEIKELRGLLHDPINDDLEELLDFRFEGEPSIDGDLDVSPDSSDLMILTD